jgi:hypothetical protein
MKIRMKGASLRLRLTQTEVDHTASGNSVEERIPFPGSVLSYSLSAAPAGQAQLNAEFDGRRIRITVPAEQLQHWATSNEVGIAQGISLSGGHTLEVLIEKDFRCLTDRPSEDESDHFPNPLGDQAAC